ncbi:MAG: ribonuclease P protein component [Burkholderiaceae bacterium]|nr:ribonuclease P protein component [Burkholderiaceae bacterium]
MSAARQRYRFARAARLQQAAEFAALSRGGSWRASGRWLALVARFGRGGGAVAPVRFGFTVGRRFARRAVDRVLVKRILREAARHALPQLAAVARQPIDVLLRLSAPLPAGGRRAVKRALRAEADVLLTRLLARLAHEGER